MAIQVIAQNQPCDVYIKAYTAGKEELLVGIARHFKTRIFCSEERFADMKLVGLDEHFTLDESTTWIFLNRLSDSNEAANDNLYDRVHSHRLRSRKKRYIRINPSGWCNSPDILQPQERVYYLPFSSHSNFHELEKFVASVRPAVLHCVVNWTKNQSISVRNIKHWHQYTFALKAMEQRGMRLLRELYVKLDTRSDDYQFTWQPENRAVIMETLGIESDEGTGDDTRGYSTRTYARQALTDQYIENPEERPKPKAPAPPKPKGKDQRIDRMVKKAAKLREQKPRAKSSDPNRLVKQLHGAKGERLEEQVAESSEYIATLGKPIEVYNKVVESRQRREELESEEDTVRELGYETRPLEGDKCDSSLEGENEKGEEEWDKWDEYTTGRKSSKCGDDEIDELEEEEIDSATKETKNRWSKWTLEMRENSDAT